jgi:hypothetical protein
MAKFSTPIEKAIHVIKTELKKGWSEEVVSNWEEDTRRDLRALHKSVKIVEEKIPQSYQTTVWCRCDCGHIYKHIAKGKTEDIRDEMIAENECPKCRKGGSDHTDYYDTKAQAQAGE